MGRIFVVITLKDDGTYELEIEPAYSPDSWDDDEIASFTDRIYDLVAELNEPT